MAHRRGSRHRAPRRSARLDHLRVSRSSHLSSRAQHVPADGAFGARQADIVVRLPHRPGMRAIIGFEEIAAQPGRARDPPRHLVIALRSEENTSELTSLMRISYPVLCLKKKN